MSPPTLSHYRIVRKIGGGGMGEVYEAEDVRLGRHVALKLLPSGLTRDPDAKARLVHEARAACLLDHPHICTVYDIEELDTGEILLAMAYCDGEPLSAHIARGPLPVAAALDYACQVADALAEAHARGIVHRDVKPANLMVTASGRLKIIDFGVAYLPDATLLTVTGTTPGTPAYMAPEQVRGEQADGRADLWALGVVLYEMLAGRRPFAGDSVEAVLYATVHEAPPPLDRARGGLPPALVTIVNRALAKDRRARYQQAEQMLADLRACRERLEAAGREGAGVVVAPRVPSIAVLPFANLSGDPGQEYFCDGMTEELIIALGSVEGLRVAAATSTFYLKGQALDIRGIGERLNVETLVEGSVRTSGNRLRLTAQLVNVSDGYHLWAERYDRQLDDVFAVQDEIARAIVERLKMKLAGAAGEGLARRASTNPEAHQAYLQGRYFFARRYKGGLERAVECFERAIARDPAFAPAHAGLALALGSAGFWGLIERRGLATKALAAAGRALALDEHLADAHTAIGMVHSWLDWNWDAGERAFTRALALDPNASAPHAFFSLSLAAAGRTADAARRAEQAMALDPLSAMVFFLAASAFYVSRNNGRAIETAQQAVTLDPGCVPAEWILSFALTEAGRYDEAVEAAERGMRLVGRTPFMLSPLGVALARSGAPDWAREIVAEFNARSAREPIMPVWMASIHDALGEVEEGIAALERGLSDWGPGYVLTLAGPPVDRLRGDPRFTAIMESVGYAGPWATAR